MTRNNFLLRSRPSLLNAARALSAREGITLEQFINAALAEKLAAMRTGSYFAERAARADVPKALAILKRAGKGNPPMRGDELPKAKRKRR